MKNLLSVKSGKLPFYKIAILKLVRALPVNLRGRLRVVRYLIRSIKGPVVVKMRNGLFINLPSVKEPISQHIIANGYYEIGTTRCIEKYLRPDDVFIDVGANIGSISLFIANRIKCKIIAIEADPAIAKILQSNISLNEFSSIYCVNCFCGSSVNGEQLQFGRAKIESFGMGSISKRGHEDTIPVQVRKLDEIVGVITKDKVGVIKIDVEGAEYFVLDGAKSVIDKHQPTIIFEFNDWAERNISDLEVGMAQKFLLDLNYNLYVFDDEGYIIGDVCFPMVEGSAMILALPGKQVVNF